MVNQVSVLMGAIQYEFKMQIRRRALWITFIIVFGLFALFFATSSFLKEMPSFLAHNTLITTLVFWTFYVNTYMPICVGVLLADRLPRDRKLKVDELLGTFPARFDARLIGKYLGSMLATLTPMFLFYVLGLFYITVVSANILALPLGLVTFLVIVIPGMLFISAFSIACPAIMSVPVYQFLFIGYWLWGNIFWFRTEIPTLGRTILSPIGIYMAFGIFGGGGFDTKGIHATFLDGVASMVVQIGIALLVLFALVRYLRWRQEHQ